MIGFCRFSSDVGWVFKLQRCKIIAQESNACSAGLYKLVWSIIVLGIILMYMLWNTYSTSVHNSFSTHNLLGLYVFHCWLAIGLLSNSKWKVVLDQGKKWNENKIFAWAPTWIWMRGHFALIVSTKNRCRCVHLGTQEATRNYWLIWLVSNLLETWMHTKLLKSTCCQLWFACPGKNGEFFQIQVLQGAWPYSGC